MISANVPAILIYKSILSSHDCSLILWCQLVPLGVTYWLSFQFTQAKVLLPLHVNTTTHQQTNFSKPTLSYVSLCKKGSLMQYCTHIFRLRNA
jgi:hypothetical protein